MPSHYCRNCEKNKQYNITENRVAPYPPESPFRCNDCHIESGGYHHFGCDKRTCFQFGAPLELCPCFAERRLKALSKTVDESVNKIFGS